MAEKIIFEMEIEAKLDKALKGVEEIVDGTKEINENLKDTKKASQNAVKGLKGIAKGFKGIGLAMKAGGFFLITEAFKFLKEIMMQNQTVMDAVSVATTSLGIIFNDIASFAVNLGESIFNAFSQPQKTIDSITTKLIGLKDYIVDKFSGVGTILRGIFTGSFETIKEGLAEIQGDFNDFRGDVTDVYEDVKDVATETFNTIVEKTKEAIEVASEITTLRNEVRLLEAEQTKLMFTYLQEQETLRQTRDDVTKTYAERIEANNKLGESLMKQFEEEKAIVEEKVRLAQLELSTNETSIEKKENLINAEAELADLKERITGFESEQLINLTGLNQELLDAEKELATFGKTSRELEIEELDQWYKEKIKLAKKAGQDTTAVEKEYAKRQAKIQQTLEEEKLSAISNTISMSSALFKEGSIAQKALLAGGAVLDTYSAIVKTLRAFSGVPIPGYAIAQSIITGAVGFANVKKILETDVESTSVSATSTSAGGGSQAPQINTFEQSPTLAGSSSIFDLGDSLSDFQQPVQAYVVQQDISDMQQAQNEILNRSTL